MKIYYELQYWTSVLFIEPTNIMLCMFSVDYTSLDHAGHAFILAISRAFNWCFITHAMRDFSWRLQCYLNSAFSLHFRRRLSVWITTRTLERLIWAFILLSKLLTDMGVSMLVWINNQMCVHRSVKESFIIYCFTSE